LAERLGLKMADRMRLNIETIGAIDCDLAQRKERRRQRKNAARAADRCRAGAKPHAESDARMKPWEAEGMSRAKWCRLRKRETESCTPIESLTGVRELVSPPVQPLLDKDQTEDVLESENPKSKIYMCGFFGGVPDG
jgi:hypothetical protein